MDPTDTVVPVTKRAKRGECHAVLKKEDALKDSTVDRTQTWKKV